MISSITTNVIYFIKNVYLCHFIITTMVLLCSLFSNNLKYFSVVPLIIVQCIRLPNCIEFDHVGSEMRMEITLHVSEFHCRRRVQLDFFSTCSRAM